MNGRSLQQLNNAVSAGQVKVQPIEQSDASSLRALHSSVFRVSEAENIIYRCEACRDIRNPKAVEVQYRNSGIGTITEACEELWGPAYVPVNFTHDLEGGLLDPEQVELMLVGFAPGGATNRTTRSNIDLIDIHSVALGLKWAEYGGSAAQRNLSNIEYILEQINRGIGKRDYFSIGRNIHLTNLFKCRSYGTSVSPFRQEAELCCERHLRNEIELLPNLKAIVVFMQKQNFPPLIRRQDAYGTFRSQDDGPLLAFMWHFANPGFNNQRSKGKFDEFCPRLGKEIRTRIRGQ